MKIRTKHKAQAFTWHTPTMLGEVNGVVRLPFASEQWIQGPHDTFIYGIRDLSYSSQNAGNFDIAKSEALKRLTFLTLTESEINKRIKDARDAADTRSNQIQGTLNSHDERMETLQQDLKKAKSDHDDQLLKLIDAINSLPNRLISEDLGTEFGKNLSSAIDARLRHHGLITKGEENGKERTKAQKVADLEKKIDEIELMLSQLKRDLADVKKSGQ